MKLKKILVSGVIGVAVIMTACSHKTPTTTGETSSGPLVMPAKYDINRHNRTKTSSNKQAKRMATKRTKQTTMKRTAKRRATKERIAKHNQPARSASSPYVTN